MTKLEDAARELLSVVSSLNCGDNSCQLATKRGGMRTNGGCRCNHLLAENTVTLRRIVSGLARLRAALDAPKVAPPTPSEVCPNGCETGAGTCVLDWEPTYDTYGARDDDAWRCWICNCGWMPGEPLLPKERAK